MDREKVASNTIKHYSAIKKTELLSHATTQELQVTKSNWPGTDRQDPLNRSLEKGASSKLRAYSAYQTRGKVGETDESPLMSISYG